MNPATSALPQKCRYVNLKLYRMKKARHPIRKRWAYVHYTYTLYCAFVEKYLCHAAQRGRLNEVYVQYIARDVCPGIRRLDRVLLTVFHQLSNMTIMWTRSHMTSCNSSGTITIETERAPLAHIQSLRSVWGNTQNRSCQNGVRMRTAERLTVPVSTRRKRTRCVPVLSRFQTWNPENVPEKLGSDIYSFHMYKKKCIRVRLVRCVRTNLEHFPEHSVQEAAHGATFVPNIPTFLGHRVQPPRKISETRPWLQCTPERGSVFSASCSRTKYLRRHFTQIAACQRWREREGQGNNQSW